MSFIIIVVFLSVALFSNALHLSSVQMYSVRKLLNNPELPIYERVTIQRVLYISHEKWAVKKAIEFKTLHRHKCMNIPLNELALSGKIGLFKSTKRYNGSSNFIRFSDIYVKSELLRTMTSYLSTTSCISKRDRLSAVALSFQMRLPTTFPSNATIPTKIITKSSMRIPLFGKINPSELASSELQPPDRICDAVEGLPEDTFARRILWLKYDGNKRSNKHIAELMCCSEETVRLQLQNLQKNSNTK